MRVVTLVALDLVLLLVGETVLYALGLVRSFGAGARLGGLGLLVGWSLLGVASSFALMAGSPLGLVTIVALAAALGIGGVVAGRKVSAARVSSGWRPTPFRLAASGGGAIVVVVVLVELLRRAWLLGGAWEWDAWAFWIPKAETIVYRSGIGTGPGSFSSFANPDYPPFVPAADATVFRFAGKVDPALLAPQHWLLAAAFLAALVGLFWHRVPPELLLPCVAVLSVLPAFDASVSSLLAEDSLLIALGLAGASGALWLLERDWRHAMLFAVFAAAVSLMKNEGFSFALLLGVLLAAASLRRNPRIAPLLALAPVLAILPWKLWLKANHVPPNSYYSASDLLRPSRTVEHLGRLWTALAEVPGYYLRFDRSLVVLPVVGILLVAVGRRRPPLALVTFGFIAVAIVGNLAVYWVSTAPLQWYIETSADRTSTGPIVLAAVLLPLLAAEALETGRSTAARAGTGVDRLRLLILGRAGRGRVA